MREREGWGRREGREQGREGVRKREGRAERRKERELHFFPFTQVMPPTLLQTFDAQELEFLIAGTLEIDVDDWKNHTEYRNGE